jgi:hypothetical protein
LKIGGQEVLAVIFISVLSVYLIRKSSKSSKQTRLAVCWESTVAKSKVSLEKAAMVSSNAPTSRSTATFSCSGMTFQEFAAQYTGLGLLG